MKERGFYGARPPMVFATLWPQKEAVREPSLSYLP